MDEPLHDLVTPDCKLMALEPIDERTMKATVTIEGIQDQFVGFSIDKKLILFNIKSTLAQIGLNGTLIELELDYTRRYAQAFVLLKSHGPIAREMLHLLPLGARIGKLFAADDRRRVRHAKYLSRMFGRSDREGRPLLLLGGLPGSDSMILDEVDGRCIAYLALKNGKVNYESSIFDFLSTMQKVLVSGHSVRKMLSLHQQWIPNAPRNAAEDEILLVKTAPLHIRTVFAKVVDELLSPGYVHTTASVLQPDTKASGDIYELIGNSKREVTDIPLEFYTLEPYREHVFFSDRDQLQTSLEDPEALKKAFSTMPENIDERASVFVVKGSQMHNLRKEDWVVRPKVFNDLPGMAHGSRQALFLTRFIEQQSAYPFLKAIEDGIITSQGVLFTRYFPSPILKRMLLSENVARCLKGIYFKYPSASHTEFFSNEDRALLNDLHKFVIPVYWVDERTEAILQYVQKPERETGMFVPLKFVDTYVKGTIFGVYGSNLRSEDFETTLSEIFKGILELQKEVEHPLLDKNKPIALITGGGPGAMEVGNKIAKEHNILSCANIADFRKNDGSVVNEQKQNPYVEAKMTYRFKELVERQAQFNLDFPIFLTGGIGTDFEFALEEVRRKVGSVSLTPILLLGRREDWKDKITGRFTCNLRNKTIEGSEWVSNCFYFVENAKEALAIYRAYFSNRLPIGPSYPHPSDGFYVASELIATGLDV